MELNSKSSRRCVNLKFKAWPKIKSAWKKVFSLSNKVFVPLFWGEYTEAEIGQVSFTYQCNKLCTNNLDDCNFYVVCFKLMLQFNRNQQSLGICCVYLTGNRRILNSKNFVQTPVYGKKETYLTEKWAQQRRFIDRQLIARENFSQETLRTFLSKFVVAYAL